MTSTDLEKLCLSLKGAKADIKWGNDLCYTVGSKMFCVTNLQGPFFVSFKTTAEEFGELTARDGIKPAPYSARHGWVLVENREAFRPAEWKSRILQSYDLVVNRLPKRTRQLLK